MTRKPDQKARVGSVTALDRQLLEKGGMGVKHIVSLSVDVDVEDMKVTP